MRTGSHWAEISKRYGPATTCYNRFVRYRNLGVWDRIYDTITAAYEDGLQIINSRAIRIHQNGANAKGGRHCRPRRP